MKRFLSLLILAALWSCKAPAPRKAASRAAMVQEIEETLRSYQQDVSSQGLTAELKYLDTSADFFWVPPGYSEALSYDTVAAILTRSASSYQSIDNSFTSLRIIPLSDALASYTARIQVVVKDTAGRSFNNSFIESGVLIKRSNGWKLLCGQTTMLK